MITTDIFQEKSIILFKQNCIILEQGVSNSFDPKGHIGHNMTPQWPGRLTEPERAR